VVVAGEFAGAPTPLAFGIAAWTAVDANSPKASDTIRGGTANFASARGG
jgi:hypothetical protein